MKTLSERGVVTTLSILFVLMPRVESPAEGPSGEGEDTGGIAKIQLSSYYESQPVSVSPGAPSYTLPLQLRDISNADRVRYRLGLDDNALQALESNGFVVVNAYDRQGKPYDNMVAPYNDLKEKGIPNFITSDSLLHLYHVQFDEILKCVEEREFYPKLVVMSNALFEESVAQYESFSGDLKEAARRNVAYFAVAMKLLLQPQTDDGTTVDDSPLDFPPEYPPYFLACKDQALAQGCLGEEIIVPDYVSTEVAAELDKIEAHSGFKDSDIFIYKEDYSQYVPRGHYTRSEILKKYFKAMMWYGRMAFLLKGGIPWGQFYDALISPEDAKTQTIQASLITLGLDSLQAEDQPIADIWNRIYAVTAFFVGLADDLTPYEYKEAILSVFGSPVNFEDFNDEDKMYRLKVELALKRSPQIYGGTGEIYIVLPPPPWPEPPLNPEQLDEVLDKSKGVRLMGQRFIPDSYMFQQLVAPVSGCYTGSGEPFTAVLIKDLGFVRGFPRGLDVMAVLGSDEALAILEREGDTEYEFFDDALGDVAALFDSFTEEDWNKNLYWSWLHTLKSLLGSCGQGYPSFMQRTPWQDKQLQTTLASWAELRHDTILYAKQSYTPGIIVSTGVIVPPEPPKPDRGYVEPVPEFYNRLLSLTRMTRTGLTDMNVLDASQQSRLSGLEDALSRLADISIAELEGGELSEEDYDYIECFGSILRPLSMGLSDDKGDKTVMVADVHTDINSGKVLEEGVGYVKLVVAAYMLPDGRVVLGAGPVFSYYEFKWPMGDRLTDEKWTEMLESRTNPPQPDWVHSFIHPVIISPEASGDTDGDQLPDAWERSFWSGIDVVNDPDADYDQDGVTNKQEYLAETDPTDPQSCFRIIGIRPDGPGMSLFWNSSPGTQYLVSWSYDLHTWLSLSSIIAEDGTSSAYDPISWPTRQRFYRIQLPGQSNLTGTPGIVQGYPLPISSVPPASLPPIPPILFIP